MNKLASTLFRIIVVLGLVLSTKPTFNASARPEYGPASLAGSIVRVSFLPEALSSGVPVSVRLTVKNEGSTAWPGKLEDANDLPSPKVGVEVTLAAQTGQQELDLSGMPAWSTPLLPGEEGIISAYGRIPADWSGAITYSARLLAEGQLVDSFSGASTVSQSDGASGIDNSILSTTTPVDIVFAIDNTGSMSSIIAQAKSDAQYIMDTIRTNVSESDFGAIKFKDTGDEYVTVVAANLTSDINTVDAAIDTMSATGGGDNPEAYIEAVKQAVNEITWRAGSIKMLIVMGDAPPHDPVYGTGTSSAGTWASAASDAANIGLRVSMVAVGYGIGDTTVQQSYQYMATATGGLYSEAPDPSTLANELISMINDLSGTTPMVIQTSPTNGATGVATSVALSVKFNLPMDATTINAFTFLVTSQDAMNRIGFINYDPSQQIAYFNPDASTPLEPGTTYTITLTSSIRAAASPHRALPKTSWSFTTFGSPREKLVKALEILRDESDKLVKYNARETANILGTTYSKNHTSTLRLTAEWALAVLRLSSGDPPEELSPNLVQSVSNFVNIILKAGKFAKLTESTLLWLGEKVSGAPTEEVAAQNYFYNSLMNDVPVYDEADNGSIAWQGTGYYSILDATDAEYDQIIADIPASLPDNQAENAIQLVEKLTADVRAARTEEVHTAFTDYVDAMSRLTMIGSMNTQREQFNQVLPLWNTTKTIKNTLFWTNMGTLGVKVVSGGCIVLTAGTVSPICGYPFAASEFVFWKALAIAGAVATAGELILTPQEKVMDSSIQASVAGMSENILIRRIYLGVANDVRLAIGLPVSSASSEAQGEALGTSPRTDLIEDQVSASDISVLDFSIGDATLSAGQSFADGSGTVELYNNSAVTRTVTCMVFIRPNGAATGADILSVAGSDTVSLLAGETLTKPISFTIPKAQAAAASGFEAQLMLSIGSPDSHMHFTSPPYRTLFTVGTVSEVQDFRDNLPVTLMSNLITAGQISEQLYTVSAPSSRRLVRFALTQPLGADLDLHIYDGSGRQIGYNYATGSVELPGNAHYSGRTSNHETIEVDSTDGPFRIQVIAIDTLGGGKFDVTAMEVNKPEWKVYMPGLFNSFNTSWLDATSGGITVAQGDDTYQYVALPFTFNFYGNSYTDMYVSSNGYVSFGAGYANLVNSCLPDSNLPNNAIYAFWDDLYPVGGTDGSIYVKQIDSSTFVVEWYQVRKFGATDHETFEIVLRDNNVITLNYLTLSNTGSSTVGVENATGTLAKQYTCNGTGSTLNNNMAIQYTTP
jgi:hypothetical protein